MDEATFLDHLREYTCIHMAGWGMPPQVHEVLSHPAGAGGQFDFGAVIHLRLLDIWDRDKFPNLLILWRSIAAQLGMIDNDDDGSVRAMLDEEDRYWWKVPDVWRLAEHFGQEAQMKQVRQVIRRRLEKVKYLLVLENVPSSRRPPHISWLEEIFPAPTRQNGCQVVVSTPRSWNELDMIPWSSASRKTIVCDFHGPSNDPYGHLIGWIERAASSMEKMAAGEIAKDISKDDLRVLIFGSLLYWWLFKYWRSVPVAELLSSWVHAEILPMLLSARGRPAPPCSPWEVGRNLMAELCRQYLLQVEWGDDGTGGRCWCRKPQNAPKTAAAAAAADAAADAKSRRLRLRRFLRRTVENLDDDHRRPTWTGVCLEYAREVMAASASTYSTADPDLGDIARHFLRAFEIDDAKKIEDNIWLRNVTLCFVARYRTKDGDVGIIEDIKQVPERIMELGSLRLLDLSDTNITSLPRSLFFNLPELRVLLLQHCKRLKVLDVRAPVKTTLLTVDDAASGALDKLRVLDLSNSSVCEISDDVLLRHMTNLQELILSNVSSLERPPTLRALGRLGIFRMTDSTALKGENLSPELLACTSQVLRVLDLSGNPSIQSLPAIISAASPFSTQLEEIHLLNCAGLERAFVSDHPGQMILENIRSLRVFTLSGTSKIQRLSLRGCSKLETIELSNLEELVELDLSGTSIVELPDNVFYLPSLRRLDVLGVQRLRRLPWLKGSGPEELNLNTCSCSLITSRRSASQVNKAPINIFVADPRILCPLSIDKRYFRVSFYVRISPCLHSPVKDEGPHPPKILEGTAICRIPYKAILSSAKKMVKKEGSFRDDRDRLKRHVEVVGGGTGGASLKAARMFMSAADSLLLRDHHYTTSLMDFITKSHDCNLKRCWLDRCHRMECVFADNRLDQFSNLESLWVSKLPRLTRVWNDLSYKNFNNLKLLHLEYCPYIVSIFPLEINLDALERLVIKFCPRLEQVFAHKSRSDGLSARKVSLCQLQAMELLELPKLASISSVSVRSPCKTWKLKVRGCWRLRELPTFFTDDPTSKVSDVVIDGEPLWKKNLVINSTVTLAL